jgi:hypothetical protein
MIPPTKCDNLSSTDWISLDDNKNKSYKQHLKNELESIQSCFIAFFKFTRTYRCLKRKLKYLNDLKNVYFSKIKTPYNYLILNLTFASIIWLLITIFTYDDVRAAVKAQNLKYSILCDNLLNKTIINYSSSYNYHKNYLQIPSSHYNYTKTDKTCPCKLVGHCLARKPPDNFHIFTNDLEFSQFKEFFMHPVQLGGYWRPPKCVADFNENQLDVNLNSIERVTFIIVPFMNRYDNLRELLYNLHPFLQRQYLNYRIVVVEQANSKQSFNKGRLYNTAFNFLRAIYSNNLKSLPNLNKLLDYNEIRRDILGVHEGRSVEFNCMILHDVDLLPESDYNIYECDERTPRHLSLLIRRNEALGYYKNLYELLVGGVLSLKPFMYEKINGFSNEYWKWGAEDDGKI